MKKVVVMKKIQLWHLEQINESDNSRKHKKRLILPPISSKSHKRNSLGSDSEWSE